MVIGVCGTYFSGKSITAGLLSNKLNIYTVIHTDVVRVILANIMNLPLLKTSTYKLKKEDLEKQFEIVSKYTIELSHKLLERGEPHIIEGIHFSKDLVDFIKENGKLIFIENNLKLEDRVMLKKVTRYKLRVITGEYKYVGERLNVKETLYLKFEKNIEQIDEYIREICKNSDYRIKINKENPPWFAISSVLRL